jgi:predicted nucleic acid-binding protein
MPYLLDSGILLRLLDDRDPKRPIVQAATEELGRKGAELFITTQNIAELWNVATRPTANNGLALPQSKVAEFIVRTIDPICAVVTEIDSSISAFRRLLTKYSVVGKQVHDARLVAMMLAWQIENILTLNDRDFRRFEPEGIRIVTPESLINANP